MHSTKKKVGTRICVNFFFPDGVALLLLLFAFSLLLFFACFALVPSGRLEQARGSM